MAYALVVSLRRTLELLPDSDSELKVIHDDLCYLKSFFDGMNSLEDSNSFEEVEKEIKDVLENTQDLIESHISDLAASESESSADRSLVSEFSREMVEIEVKLGSLITMLKAEEVRLKGDQKSMPKAKEEQLLQPPGGLDALSPTSVFGVRNEKIVGLDDELAMLKQRVLGEHSRYKVIHIVGMAGVGKSTLAKELYLDPFINQHFKIRLFVKTDLQSQLNDVLLSLVRQIASQEMEDLTVDDLGVFIYRYLLNRRYLVVLDDVWDPRTCQHLLQYLPSNKNGSAVILTTRLIVASSRDQEVLQKRFLSDDQSWDLLRMKVFSVKWCPPELEEIGETIARNLGGLPLAVEEIGELLCSSPYSMVSWSEAAQNMNSLIQKTRIPKIWNPSYTQLPRHLKACFLYLGVFPPNHNIPTSQLLKLWVAEGFIVPVAAQSLEEQAERYLQDLVSRNLVTVHQRSSRGRIKTCRIHVVVHHLCVTEARLEKLYHVVVKEGNRNSPSGTNYQRGLGFHSNSLLGFKHVQNLMESVPDARSLLCLSPQYQQPLQVYLGFKWLRVLHALSIRFFKFPDEVPKLFRLRYLAITCDRELPASISRLWNLEFLIIRRSQSISSYVFLPLEIWRLHKLRHLECMGFDLPHPPGSLTLKRLLTLSGVSARSCIDGVLARMPNLIKLWIWFEFTHTQHSVENLYLTDVSIHLHKLESFKCLIKNIGPVSGVAFSLTVFPYGLRKLTLSGCGFVWHEHMAVISELQLLEVLKLRWSAFCGPEWELHEGGFRRLKFLLLEDLDVEQLIFESESVFPLLRQLLIRRCYNLQEIPIDIGNIPTLEVIEVHDCNKSLTESARIIQEEQFNDYGNESLQVRIYSSWDDDVLVTSPS